MARDGLLTVNGKENHLRTETHVKIPFGRFAHHNSCNDVVVYESSRQGNLLICASVYSAFPSKDYAQRWKLQSTGISLYEATSFRETMSSSQALAFNKSIAERE